MHRDTASDCADYKPKLRHLSDTNYWSDENICREEINSTQYLWQTPLTQMESNTESKNDTITDEQLTPGIDLNNSSNNINNNNNNNNNKIKNRSVRFADSQNQIQSMDNSNFMPGSNQSPSILSDTHHQSANSNIHSVKITGNKRSLNRNKQNDDTTVVTPAKKRKRFS